MSSRVKKRNKVARQVIDDMFAKRISVPEARARLEWVKKGKYQAQRPGPRRAAVVKSASVTTGYEQFLASANPQIRETARSAQAAQVAGMVEEAVAKVLKSAEPVTPAVPAVPAGTARWSGADRELLAKAEFHADPYEREAARRYLVSKGMLPGGPDPGPASGKTRTIQVFTQAPGPGGEPAQAPPLELPGLCIAPPGSAGR